MVRAILSSHLAFVSEYTVFLSEGQIIGYENGIEMLNGFSKPVVFDINIGSYCC